MNCVTANLRRGGKSAVEIVVRCQKPGFWPGNQEFSILYSHTLQVPAHISDFELKIHMDKFAFRAQTSQG